MVVVIARGAATGDDDGDWDSNSANVGLAVIRQSVAFPGQLWEAYAARQARGENEFADLPRSAIQLAKWKYGAAPHAL